MYSISNNLSVATLLKKIIASLPVPITPMISGGVRPHEPLMLT